MSVTSNCRVPGTGQIQMQTCTTNGCECAAAVKALRDSLDATIQALVDRIVAQERLVQSLERERVADARLWAETVFAREVRNG